MVKVLKNNLWLVIIVLIASFFRIYKLDYLELFGDELDAGYQSYSLLVSGRDYKGHLLPAYAQSFSEWRAPGLMYAMIPFIRIFGLNEWGVRLCPAFFGIISLLAWYWLLSVLKVPKAVNLWSTFFLGIIPWQVQYSRSGYELTLMSSMLILGSVFWIKFFKEGKFINVILAGIFYSIALYTYNTANLYVPLLVLMIAIVFGWQWNKIFKLFLVGFLLCIPLIINIIFGSAANRFKLFSVWGSKEISTEVINLRNQSSSKYNKIFYNKVYFSVKRIIFNYSNAFSSEFLFNQGDVTFRQSLHHVGNIFWSIGILIIVGLIGTLFMHKYSLADKFMWWFTLLAPIPSSLTIDGYNHASRLFVLGFPLMYWAGKGIKFLSGKFVWIIISAILFEFLFYQFYYWQNYRSESWRWWHTGYKELMLNIKADKANFDKVLIDNVYEPSLVRYLFWNQINPKEISNLSDKMEQKIGNFNSFKLPQENVYFVDFGGPIKADSLEKNTLYAFSQDINVVGDRDLNTQVPEGIKIIKTIRNYFGVPIFYLVVKS